MGLFNMSDLKKVFNALTNEYLTVKAVTKLSTVTKYKAQEKLNELFEAGKIQRKSKRSENTNRMALHYKLIEVNLIKKTLSQKW